MRLPSLVFWKQYTQRYGHNLYVILGMPIRDDDKSDVVYNGLMVATPDGLAGSYHKIHLPAPEPNWATRGDKPFILDTPWGTYRLRNLL